MARRLGPHQTVAVAVMAHWTHCFASPADRLYCSLEQRGLVKLKDDVWRSTPKGHGVACVLNKLVGSSLSPAGEKLAAKHQALADQILPPNAAEVVSGWVEKRMAEMRHD